MQDVGEHMTEHDDVRISITLTRRQWRAIKAEIGDLWSGANDVLWEELDSRDLEPAPPPTIVTNESYGLTDADVRGLMY
jgi:hypothetical protein